MGVAFYLFRFLVSSLLFLWQFVSCLPYALEKGLPLPRCSMEMDATLVNL